MTRPEPYSAGTPDRRATRLIVAALFVGVFLSALDTMIMATSLRTIADHLNGMTGQAWVMAAYLVTMTVSAPLYGKLSDTFGRRSLYIAAIAIFIVGSVMCAFAQSIYQLGAFRAVQGLGAGGLMTLALAITADLFPPARRVRYQANLGLVFGVASVAGPVAGGVFAGADTLLWTDGWRWIFLLNVPLGGLCLYAVARHLRAGGVRTTRRVDVAGAVLLIVAVTPLLLVAEQGQAWGWLSVPAATAYVLGIAGVVAFLAVEKRMGDAAILPPRLFRSRPFSMVNVVNFTGGMGVFGALAVLPLYLQLVQGLTPTAAGLLLLPQSIFTTIGAYLCGPITTRTGRVKPLLVTGVAIMSACYVALASMHAGTSLVLVVLVVSVMGLGLGLFFQTVLIALQTSVPPSDIGVASGLYSFSRQLGGALGTAVFLSVLFGTAAGAIADARHTDQVGAAFARAASDPVVLADQENRAAAAAVEAGPAAIDLDDTSFLRRVHPDIAAPYVSGLNTGMRTVFLAMSGIVLISAITALLIPEPRRKPRDPGALGKAPTHPQPASERK